MFFPSCCRARRSSTEVKSYAPAGIILSGAPWSVYDKDAPPADARVFELGLPVLGICYGLQFMVHTLGGKVRPADKREYGRAEIDIVSDSILFQGLAKKLAVWMSHGDEALELPPGFELMAKTHYAVAGIQNTAKKWYAVQFHPEVHHTPQGTQILKNFIFQICGAKPTWTAAALHQLHHRTSEEASRHADAPSARSRAAWILRSRRCWSIARCAMRKGSRA